MLRPRALFKENFCGRRVSSGYTGREVQLRMFASHRSFGLAFLFSLGCLQLDVSGLVASVKGKEIAGKIALAKVTNSQRINDPLVNIWMIAECPSQLSSGKIFWKLLTVKQQTGIQDLATVHLV